MTEDELIARAQHGDREAADQLLRPYQELLWRYVARMLHDAAEAQDVIQETYMHAWQALPRYRDRGYFRAWLFRLAHREALKALRRRACRPATPGAGDPSQLLEQCPAVDPDPAHMLDQKERRLLVQGAVASLPVHERDVLTLRLETGLPFREIARIVGAPLNTVLARMHRGVRRLEKSGGLDR